MDRGIPVLPPRSPDYRNCNISLSGLNPHDDIDIIFTGLRPGEKLTEELYDAEEISPYAEYEKLLVLTSEPRSGLVAMVEEFLEKLPNFDPEQIRTKLTKLMPEYRPWDSVTNEFHGSSDGVR